jgi:hypothetical protein
MSAARTAARVALVAVAIAGAAAAAALAFGPRLLHAAIERAGPALIGREVHAGGAAIDWGRRTTLAATDLSVANAAWAARQPMLSTARAAVTFDLLDLLRLRLAPAAIEVRDPVLRLARNAEGEWNIPGGGSSTRGGSEAGEGHRATSWALRALRALHVEGGEVILDDRASAAVDAHVTGLSVRPQDSRDGIAAEGRIALGAAAPIPFSVQAGPFAGRPGEAGLEPIPVRVALGPETARLSADGRVAVPPGIDGLDMQVEAHGEDLSPLLAALGGLQVPPTPAFEASASVKGVGRELRLRDISARLGGSRIEGKASLALGPRTRPRLSFDLDAPQAALADFRWLGPAGASPPGAGGGDVPTGWLDMADMQGSLRLAELKGLADGGSLRAGVELSDRVLRIDPFHLALASGSASGHAVLDAAEGPPSVALHVEAKGLRLEPLLAAVGTQMVEGALTTASATLHGRGTSWGAIAGSLDGHARFRIDDGTIAPSRVRHMALGLGEAFGLVFGAQPEATPLVCAIGDIPVQQGVARAERLVAVLPSVAITAEGEARLGEGTIQLRLTPQPLDGAVLRLLAPADVSGSLWSPEVEVHTTLGSGPEQASAARICGQDGRKP